MSRDRRYIDAGRRSDRRNHRSYDHPRRDYDDRDRSRHRPRKRHEDSRRRPDRYPNTYIDDSRKRRRSHSPSSSSHSSDIDDSIGHYEGGIGDIIQGRYTLEKELGTGTFGKVFLCQDSKHHDHIALKIVRSIDRYIDSAKIEADILADVYKKMKEYHSNTCMKMYSHFSYHGYYCVVCEPLGMSLYEYIKMNDYIGFPLSYVRDIARQLLEAMEFLEKMKLVHTDLKLENILFVSSSLTSTSIQFRGKSHTISLPTSTRIKLIDFGGATYVDDPKKGTIINTRQYRSPEVTLEVGWSYPSDLWCVGCIIAEVYAGDLLFPAHEELEHLAMMEKCVGSFPTAMIRRSKHHHKYFHSDGRVRVKSLSEDSKRAISDVHDIKDYFSVSPGDHESGIVELIQGLLRLDPQKRLHPSEGLICSFFDSSRIG